MLQYKVKFDELKWEESIEGVRCKIFKYGEKQLRLIEYSKKMPPHWCDRGHYGYILEGKFEIEYQNDKVTYESGDGIFIPHGEEHRHKARALSKIVKVIFVEDV